MNEYRYIDYPWLNEVATGLTAGAEKHPGETWHDIPAKEHAVRALRHLSLWLAGDRSDEHIINASMRCMMARVMECERMNMHYLSHPFSGNEEKNRAAAEAIQRELQERYPKTLYINPIAQFKALAGMEYNTIMGYCLELLDKCGAVTMTGDYRASKGCMIELAYAREYHIPVFFYDAQKHEYVEEA